MYTVQVRELTICNGGIQVTVPLSPDGISVDRAMLLYHCVGVLAWCLRQVLWAANLYQALCSRPVTW